MSNVLDDGVRLAAVNRKKPAKADIVALVGPQRIVEHPDGTWEANLSGPREMAALHEMTQPWRRAEIEVHGEIQARERDVPARLKATGEARWMKERDEYRAAKRGKLAPLRGVTVTVPDLPWKKAKRG